MHLDGLAAPIRTASNVAKFDLTMTMSEDKAICGPSLNYNIDLFDAATIERMLGHFQMVAFEGIVADPDQRISELTVAHRG